MKQKNRYNPSMNYTDFFYYLVNYYLTSSKVTYTVNQLVMRILVQIWAFYNDAF